MKKVVAVHANSESFKSYGRVEDLKSYERAGNECWSAWMTTANIIEGSAFFGMGTAKTAVPYVVTELSVISDNYLALFGADQKRFYIAVARQLDAEKIEAFYIEPGEVIVVNKGIWCSSLKSDEAGSRFFIMLPKSAKCHREKLDESVEVGR